MEKEYWNDVVSSALKLFELLWYNTYFEKGEKHNPNIRSGGRFRSWRPILNATWLVSRWNRWNGDECRGIKFAGFALFQDEEKLVFPFRFEYSYETDEYKCYSKHFSDEIVEDEFAYFIVEHYERSFRKVKEVLQKRDLWRL